MTNACRRAVRSGPALLVFFGSIGLGACATGPSRIALEPGPQTGPADVDFESGSVTIERDLVMVTAQGALLPAPRSGKLHPTFWVTVQNDRDERISVRPTDARLVDTFGNQLEPVPMSVDRGGREVGYALVDPEIRTYVGLHFGWPYYPIYPYPGWYAHPRYGRTRYWAFDPFWTFGFGPVWVTEVWPRRTPPRVEAPVRDKLEFVYPGARLTYVVIFPELGGAVRDMRLIVPEVEITLEEGGARALDFELVFEQIFEGER
jgi:hypothetical protein